MFRHKKTQDAGQAAELAARCSALVHRNQRKWRVLGERIEALRAAMQSNGRV